MSVLCNVAFHIFTFFVVFIPHITNMMHFTYSISVWFYFTHFLSKHDAFLCYYFNWNVPKIVISLLKKSFFLFVPQIM